MDWYPWGEEALARAREEELPILLSIGYSACHWCHVMERESFEDPETARAHERALRLHQARPRGAPGPRLDLHGGLPGHDRARAAGRSTSSSRPSRCRSSPAPTSRPSSRMGMPSWRSVLDAVANAWDERRDEIRAGRRADRRAAARRRAAASRPSSRLRRGALDEAVEALRAQYDRANGGFGGAPKFPPASAIEFLLRRGETEMTAHTLRAMASGGMYDQVGGGFARYSVDPLLARPPLREDALRQRAARARLPARLAGHRRAAVPHRRRGDARLGAARDARARGRLLLGARRRLRGRGGQVLRLDASRRCAPRSRASRTPTRRSPGSAPPTAATSRARNIPVRGPGEPERRDDWRRAPLRGPRRSGSGRDSTTSASPPGTR